MNWDFNEELTLQKLREKIEKNESTHNFNFKSRKGQSDANKSRCGKRSKSAPKVITRGLFVRLFRERENIRRRENERMTELLNQIYV